MGFFDKKDWKDWLNKVKWQLISFKVMSFIAFFLLLILSWLSLEEVYNDSVQVTERLYERGMIGKEQVVTLLTQSREILYDKALSHILLFIGSIMTAIIAIKGVSYWVSGKQFTDVVKNLEPVHIKEKLEQIIKKR